MQSSPYVTPAGLHVHTLMNTYLQAIYGWDDVMHRFMHDVYCRHLPNVLYAIMANSNN